MGNSNSTNHSPLKRQWGPNNVQKFMIHGHKNKIFGCDVINPTQSNNNELWVASCSADGKLLINEVLIETIEQKHTRERILSQQSSNGLTNSKSLSSTQHKTDNTGQNKKANNKIKPFEISIHRLLSIPLDSTYCYTLSLHPNCRYVSTCIDKLLFIFQIDFNTESPIYNLVKIAQKYISECKFIDNKHIIFSSGDGNVYIYNFIIKKLIYSIKYKENNDILCMDYGTLNLSKYETKKELIVFGTLDGHILIYDITNIITNDNRVEKNKNNKFDNNAILLQSMSGQFGGELTCMSMSNNGKFIVIGSEDNTYNIYNISLLLDENGNVVNIKWILLYKQIVMNDANISHIAWVNNTQIIASCDKGNELYLSGIYDIRDCKKIIQILNKYMMKIENEYDNKQNELSDIISYIIDIILQYIQWVILHYKMNVDFKDRISCLATCPNVNNGAGLIVCGGFSKLLECFLPLQSIQ